MRRMIIFLLVFAMIATLGACSTSEPGQPATTEPIRPAAMEPSYFATIEAKNCYTDAGFVAFIAGAESSVTYTFTAENSADVQWWVYVLDEAFDDGFRYIKQVAEPTLVGDGDVTVNAGQYVYVYCSANEFTVDTRNESAKLNVAVK